jgi:hypothetical protein
MGKAMGKAPRPDRADSEGENASEYQQRDNISADRKVIVLAELYIPRHIGSTDPVLKVQ